MLRSGPCRVHALLRRMPSMHAHAIHAGLSMHVPHPPAPVPMQTVFLEAIQGGQDATDLFEFRWPRERQASRTSTILSLTNRQHGIMYALAGCSDVMYVMSRVKAEVRTRECLAV